MEEETQSVCAQTIAEKILSSHASKAAHAGDVVMASVDVVMATDGSGPLALDFYEKMDGNGVFDVTRVLMVLDHYVPCPNDKVARLHDRMRRFHKDGMCTLFDLGEGICHQLLPEKGYIQPGALVIGGDSHSTTYGALNCFGTGLGSSDLASAMISGKIWFRVPESIRIELSGSLPPGSYAKDVALWLVGQIGAAGGTYKALEFCGDGISSLSISERMTICNLMVETGAKCAIMPFDDNVAAHMAGQKLPFRYGGSVSADAEAKYEREINCDLESIPPMLARPHQPDNIIPLADLEGTPIHMGVLGTCTNGRMDDLEIAMTVLGEKKLAAGFELLVIPASRIVYAEASRRGLLAAFVDKGAVVLPPGCGPCCGSSPGIPSDGENVMSTANRNFLGRMGNVKANIYLASPASVAAAATTGVVTIPKVSDGEGHIP
jgi:3-isopropylmalate/(R)-2-methylmalate dehydratase large subunit